MIHFVSQTVKTLALPKIWKDANLLIGLFFKNKIILDVPKKNRKRKTKIVPYFTIDTLGLIMPVKFIDVTPKVIC